MLRVCGTVACRSTAITYRIPGALCIRLHVSVLVLVCRLIHGRYADHHARGARRVEVEMRPDALHEAAVGPDAARLHAIPRVAAPPGEAAREVRRQHLQHPGLREQGVRAPGREGPEEAGEVFGGAPEAACRGLREVVEADGRPGHVRHGGVSVLREFTKGA